MNNLTTSNFILELKDYMFTTNNISKYTKHMIHFNNFKPKSKEILNNISIQHDNKKHKQSYIKPKHIDETITKVENNKTKINEHFYKPKQKDSLFWCFYIIKHGLFNYEMEINNKYFIIEKKEKFKYIEILRKHKELLKLHKIKPFTEIEDDLSNNDTISIKTFFALCIIENINVLLVYKRKIYELLSVNIDDEHPIHIIHRNDNCDCFEHSIELDITTEIINKYKESYYKMSSFDSKLKSISSYKLDELIELCKKFNINIEDNKKDKRKLTKKDIYDLLVLNY